MTFDIDANGIVSVFAKDMGTGKSQNIVISADFDCLKKRSSMVKEGEANAEADKKIREKVELRTN